ncbi:MAG: birA-like protein [Verrucomicrobiales bacterium]|nr:birA-like protein [Verrucomicrobiales bacterium]
MSIEPTALNGEWMSAELPDWTVVCLGRIASTNDEARRRGAAGDGSWTAVLAEEQTAGRGRRGARWVSPAGRNGMVSVLLRPGGELPAERWTRLTLAAALAGCDALDAVPGMHSAAEVKWPNDLYLSGKKVAGILVESAWGTEGGFVVVGTGFNLNVAGAEFPDELRQTATSVWMERGGLAVDRTVFLTNFLKALRIRCDEAGNGFPEMIAEAWRRSWLAGKRVGLTSAGVEMEGLAWGLGPEGELLLKMETGEVRAISSADLVRPVSGE